MESVLGLFPGLAAAAPGMGRPWRFNTASQRVLVEVSRIAEVDVERLICDAGADELYADRNWELATVACELGVAAALRTEIDLVGALPFSIGAYAALWWADALDLPDIVTMVDIVLDGCRGLPGVYAMVAVTGVGREIVTRACEGINAALSATITQRQHLVAGERAAVETAAAALEPLALSVRVLNVRWPLHTRFMAPVATALAGSRHRLAGVRTPRKPIVSAIDGRLIEDAERGWGYLVEHLTTPLDLTRAFRGARGLDHTGVVEVGPGQTLTRAFRWAERELESSCERGAEC